MHPILLAQLLAAAPAKSSGGTSFLIFIIPLLIIAYLLIFRPQKKRAQRQRQAQAAIEEGDTVVSIGGIVGRVVALDQERATLEVAPDLELEFLRKAISHRLEPATSPEEEDVEEEPEEDDDARGWPGYHPELAGEDGEAMPAPAGEAMAGEVDGAANGAGTASPATGDDLGRIFGTEHRGGSTEGAGRERPTE
ncbi:MAG TPA: preprotein translocase subunit YajC [Acidimicrobiales bacterium]|jgi:preprotein translocase subunit YajC|nr:preprotein translocase subunit YajC [Acidimicrobiales bacterium]